ncbi:MAG: hypothetical protein J5950_04045 [Clostridia bacterium]|nr:hypothetical protein [Clostridia bacterium]
MLNMIIAALRATGIKEYIITEDHSQTAELYFVRRKFDMPRTRDITEYRVRVFREFTSDGERMKGESETKLFMGSTALEVQERLAKAYDAALYVKNRYFDLCGPGEAGTACDTGEGVSAPEMASKAANTLFSADNDCEAFVNSAEVFGTVSKVRIVTSAGTDVKYVKRRVRGEYVVQCREPRDVEQYFNFEYKPDNISELASAVREALRTVRDRANAEVPPEDGVYDVILSGKHLGTILEYYVARANASMVFPGYSDWTPGTYVQGGDVSGERLTMTVTPDAPFSIEGIYMPERKLIDGGKLVFLHGNTRQCRYIGIEPTGAYRNIRVDCGTEEFESLKRGCLYPVSFSDFQLDSFSGFFGGEIRLAYLYTDDGVKILTGGSVNGNISDIQDNMVFSKERYSDSSYEGPLAVKLRGVRVAGK